MGTFLTESVPVSLSGSLGEAGNFRLYACDQPNVILYVAKQPTLMLDKHGKPGVAVTTYTTQQENGSVKIIGGAASIGLNTAPQLDQGSIDQAKALVAQLGVGDPAKLRFLPLTTQKGKALLNLPTAAGESDKKHNERDLGTPGGSISFLANLSEIGALEWSQAIKTHSRINGDITIQYDYLRRVPDVGARVHVHGQRIFEHLSAALEVSYNGFLYGGSAKLEAAWDALTRNGGIEVEFIGQGLPPDLEKYRQEMVATFTKQAMQILFDQIFAPMPQVAPAQAGSSGGFFGGANFALKWQKKTDAIELTQEIVFKGTTWLTETMDISLAALFADLDPSCLTEVPAQQAFDSVVTVDGDEMVSLAAVSMSWSAGRSPTAPVFDKTGGVDRNTVVSTNPKDIVVNCNTQINWVPPQWPVTSFTQSRKVGDGGNQMVVKPSSAVGRQMIFMFIRDGNRVLRPTEVTADDYLHLNVSFAGPHLSNTVRDAAVISPVAPVEFAYPLDMAGRPGVAEFDAFGFIGDKLMRAPRQVIPQEDSSVFILATRGGDIKLVTSQTILDEDDKFAQALVLGQGHPIVYGTDGKPLGRGRKESETAKRGRDYVLSGNGNGTAVLAGQTLGVEHGTYGASLWLKLSDGSRRKVRLLRPEDSERFERASRSVEVTLDPSGEYAESIFISVNS